MADLALKPGRSTPDDNARSEGRRGRKPPIISAAMRDARAGRLDEAVARLRDGSDLANPDVNLVYLRLLFELQDYAGLQGALRNSIDVGNGPAGPMPPGYLATLLHFAERACLPLAELEQLGNVAAPFVRLDDDLRPAWKAFMHRQRFRQRLSEDFEGHAPIISLGLHCLPWHLPGRWGLKTEEEFVSLFNPFGLSGHTTEGVIKALESDFDAYCDPEVTMVVETANGHQMPMRRDRTAFWNHNRGAYWLKDDQGPLRRSMAGKAAAFRKSCRARNAVFLMAKVGNDYPREPLDFLPRLNAALAHFTGVESNRIIISNQTSEAAGQGMVRVDEHTFFLNCPYPNADYVWHDDDTANTPEGLAFERNYISYILRILINWNLSRRVRRDTPGGDD